MAQKGGRTRPPGENPYDPETGLTPQRIRFAKFVASGETLAEAFEHAGYKCINDKGLRRTPADITTKARQICRKENFVVQRLIDELRQQNADEALLTDKETKSLIRRRNIANADEIIRIQMDCCRHCWGEHNRYQRTEIELADDREKFEEKLNELLDSENPADKKRAERMGEFDLKGGIGYTPNKRPNPDCMKCHGRGVRYVDITDTRDLSPEARSIYGGAKIKKDGSIEIVVNREGAPQLLPKIQGMLTEKVEHSGTLNVSDLTPEQREAEIRAIVAEARGTS